MKKFVVQKDGKEGLVRDVKGCIAGMLLIIALMTSVLAAGCGKENTEGTAEGPPVKSTEVLTEGTTEKITQALTTEMQAGEDTGTEEEFDPERPVIYENTWKVVPGDAIGIYGANFATAAEKAQAYLAPMSGYNGSDSFDLYQLNILSQDDGVILAEIPENVPVDNYIGYVKCGDKVSEPFYVNTPELDWLSDTEICTGLSVRVFGRNLLNPKTGTTDGASLFVCSVDGTQMLEAEIIAATEYTVDFIVPDGVKMGTRYTIQYNNGASEYGYARLDEEEGANGMSDAQRAELKELYGVDVSWASNLKLTEIFNVLDYGAVGDGEADDRAALTAALTAAGKNGGGIVYLPGGTYNLLDTKVGFSVPNNVIVAGDGQDETIILTDSPFVFSTFYGGITKLTLHSELKRPEEEATRRLLFGYVTNLVHVGGYMHFFAKDIGIHVADGQGIVTSGASQIIIEDSSIVCTHTAISITNASSLLRTRIRNNYCYNIQRELISFGPYTWVDSNLFEGQNGGNDCEKGSDGKVHTMEHRIAGMVGDKLYYGNNTIIGTFGDMREDVSSEDNCGEGILNQEDGRIGIGMVESVDGTTLFSSDMDFDAVLAGTDPVAGTKGTTLIGANIFLISGKGMGQRRTIKIAFGNKLVLDEEWLYPPQEGDLFVIDSGVPERNIIVNNYIQAETRKGGIMYYGRSYNNIIAGNTMTNSGGIWFGQAQSAKTDRFGMSYFNYVDGNHLSGGIRDKEGIDNARDNTLTIGMGDDGGCGFVEDLNLPELTAYYGNLYRNNTILGSGTDLEPEAGYNSIFMIHNGIVVADASEAVRDINKGTIVANNTVTNSLNGVSVSSLSNYTLLYQNDFRWNKVDYNDADSRNTVTIDANAIAEKTVTVNAKEIGITD
ncbi:MAG: hypothetical protein J6B85_10450 [Lachnospiraceae bacterium]|nr:hypothetical protein [Lachnospiraceae bacterium]